MADTSTTREKILTAAKARFGHYGFNKTSMTEIAKDCHMSAANIYRHFNGKNDILAALATALFQKQEEDLSRFCESPFPDCSSKLHSFFLKSLALTHHYVTEQPKMKEMVDFISQERFDLIDSHRKAQQKLIQNILQEGVHRGEFVISDVAKTAETFRTATVMFYTPLYIDLFPLSELESSCTSVVELLLGAITRTTKT